MLDHGLNSLMELPLGSFMLGVVTVFFWQLRLKK